MPFRSFIFLVLVRLKSYCDYVLSAACSESDLNKITRNLGLLLIAIVVFILVNLLTVLYLLYTLFSNNNQTYHMVLGTLDTLA
ncbi:hypothetical protein EGI31_13830 [Lacihabitans soyangensis]|uniref:Uncharacterized protein n=1 Tax=Lacihabitans soyangensis TaxID=869394 RepID=A0AAE3KVB8_9BACT|nr:hypothetical protein [Lacihabitans soyangensis]